MNKVIFYLILLCVPIFGLCKDSADIWGTLMCVALILATSFGLFEEIAKKKNRENSAK